MTFLNFTSHSIKRMANRKISFKDLELCLSYGEVFTKQALDITFYPIK